MISALVVSGDQEVFQTIRSSLGADYRVQRASSRDGGYDMLRRKRYDILFIDAAFLRTGNAPNGYREALQAVWNINAHMEIIVLSTQEMLRETMMLMKAGASNYLTYPLNLHEVKYVTQSTYESVILQSELDYLRDRFWKSDTLELIQSKSPLMKTVFDKVRSVAPTRSTVLLIGETGTGKGVIARVIHRHSYCCDSQFISVHCGAIPDTLLESELFGHEKGAFTGAIRKKLGKFEIARGGTLLLDEIGTVTPSAQIKLLQVLQDNTFQRVGGEDTILADVRIISATNTDLKKMCDEGQFRSDLFYRLNVFPIEIPPLRDRVEDIPLLVDVFLKKLNKFSSKEIFHVHPRVMEAFKTYAWPGNIRELENLIERAYILETSSMLTPESFPHELFQTGTFLGVAPLESGLSLAEARRRGVELVERRYLHELLVRHKGRIKESSTTAGVTTRQLHKLMSRYGIRKEGYK